MIGLLIKDLYVLKKQWKSYAIVGIFMIAISVMQKNYSYIGAMGGMLGMLFPLHCMATEEKDHWYQYALCLPINRYEVVLARYIATGIGCSISMFCVVAVGSYLSMTGGMVEEMWAQFIGVFCAVVIVAVIIIPLAYKLGTEKARIYLLAVFYIPFLAGWILNKMGIPMPTEQAIERMLQVLPFITIGIVGISMLISIRIFATKEV